MSQNDSHSTLSVAEEERLRGRLTKVIPIISYPHLTLRKRTSWIAVPAPSTDHFDDATIVRIADVLKARGEQYFSALLLEPLNHTPTGLVFPTSIEGLENFNNDCALFSYILFSEAFDWFIVCTKEDYYLVIGDEPLVSAVLGMVPQEAYKQFGSFAQSMAELKQSLKLLQDVLSKTEGVYADAVEGDVIEI